MQAGMSPPPGQRLGARDTVLLAPTWLTKHDPFTRLPIMRLVSWLNTCPRGLWEGCPGCRRRVIRALVQREQPDVVSFLINVNVNVLIATMGLCRWSNRAHAPRV